MPPLKIKEGSSSQSTNSFAIFEHMVERHKNCFPMIPSGKAHNEMLLGEAETQGVIDAKGSVLV